MPDTRKIVEIMTENPICCLPDTPLEEVARMMVENDCGIIPVVEDQENWRPVGVVTDRDIAVRTLAQGKNPLELTAGDCMTDSVFTISEEASVDACIKLMEEQQIRRVVVVDEGGGASGIVSQADLALNVEEEVTGELVEEVSRPTH